MTEFLKKLSKTDTRTLFAILFLLGVLTYIGLLLIVKIPADNLSLVQQIVPMIIGTLGIVVGYYFGSSKIDKTTTTTTKDTD